jgi:hypothetical protein
MCAKPFDKLRTAYVREALRQAQDGALRQAQDGACRSAESLALRQAQGTSQRARLLVNIADDVADRGEGRLQGFSPDPD